MEVEATQWAATLSSDHKLASTSEDDPNVQHYNNKLKQDIENISVTNGDLHEEDSPDDNDDLGPVMKIIFKDEEGRQIPASELQGLLATDNDVSEIYSADNEVTNVEIVGSKLCFLDGHLQMAWELFPTAENFDENFYISYGAAESLIEDLRNLDYEGVSQNVIVEKHRLLQSFADLQFKHSVAIREISEIQKHKQGAEISGQNGKMSENPFITAI